jgi:hypothetical protein
LGGKVFIASGGDRNKSFKTAQEFIGERLEQSSDVSRPVAGAGTGERP